MQNLVNINQDCHHTPLRHGIHYFEFLNPSTTAVDEWYAHLATIYTQSPADGTIKMLIDVRRSGLLPMTYLHKTGRRWSNIHPLQQGLRLAILHKPDFPVSLVQAFTRVIGVSQQYQIEFFSDKQKTDAIAWLSNIRII